MGKTPKVVFVNPSRISTGKAFVMPAAQVTLAGAIPSRLDVEPVVVDEAIERFDPNLVGEGDIVCISVLTNNCKEAYRIAKQSILQGANVVMGGPHPTLLPHEALEFGADAVVRGDGDVILGRVLEDVLQGTIISGGIYEDLNGHPFRVEGHEMAYPRLDLVDLSRYWTTSLRNNSGCIESCTFCTVPDISGRIPRYRPVEAVAREVQELYDRGIRFVIWGADNLVQVPLSTIEAAKKMKRSPAEIEAFEAERQKSLDFFRRFAKLIGGKRVWGFAQLTLRLWDDPEMLRAISNDGAIKAALFGIESVDPDALKQMGKQWNGTKQEIVGKVQAIQKEGIQVLGSMIVGLPSDTPKTIEEMRRFSVESGMSVAQFPVYEILPGSPDYKGAKRTLQREIESAQDLFPIVSETTSQQTKLSRVRLLKDHYWLDPVGSPPHLEHPGLHYDDLVVEDRKSWKYFYRTSHLIRNGLRRGWSMRGIATYVVACKGFATFYGGSVGLSVDSARTRRTSFFQRKLMSIGARLMHKIPPPRTVAA